MDGGVAASASLDEEMMNLFQNMQIDDEWDQLHREILSTRETKKMTITAFLVCVGLDPNRAYFKQLCTKTIKKVHPSNRMNSPGREFRDAVSKYFHNLADVNSNKTVSYGSPQSLETVISDWYLDNRHELRGLGISGIYLSKSNPVGIIIEAYQNCTISNEGILQMLMEDRNISETLEGIMVVESRLLSQLSSLISSPVCVKSAMVGTATLVNYKGAVVGLTCSHVIGESTSGQIVSFSEKDGDTNKFKLDSVPLRFGSGFSHADCDFAGLLPLPNHALKVNVLDEVESTVKLIKWWKDDEIPKDKENFV